MTVSGDDREAGAAVGAPLDCGSPAARWVLAATVSGRALALLDATTVNVALPTIAADLDARVGELQWTINGYTLTLAALILLAGSLADRFGRRRVFAIGVVWFAGASILCALAPTVGTLIAARILQGIGGALLTPGSLAILQASLAPRDRARAIGAWPGLGAIAAAIGPLVGGWLGGAVGWRWIFWTNLPVAAAMLWMTLRHVPECRAVLTTRRFDVEGALLATAGLGSVTWALIAAGEQGASGGVITSGVVGVLALAAFLVVQARASEPMMPLGLFTVGRGGRTERDRWRLCFVCGRTAVERRHTVRCSHDRRCGADAGGPFRARQPDERARGQPVHAGLACGR